MRLKASLLHDRHQGPDMAKRMDLALPKHHDSIISIMFHRMHKRHASPAGGPRPRRRAVANLLCV